MKAIIISVLVLLSGCSETTKVEEMCDKLRVNYKSLQKQLPIQSDIMTSMVGIEAIYFPSENICVSSVTSSLDVTALVSALSKNDNKKKQELSSFFKTEAGKSTLLETINNKFNKKKETNEFPTQMKGFVFKEIFSLQGVKMEKVVLEHRN
ncbi:hypothetical protein [Pseudoalteromonas agarivorans]|uniref:Uncharacterized protein n=1 Tax=Pseudoalteromonas agarivorans DSM 14585 TaxID=1312369 RepID=A0ACA8DU45_9GAMM|nr:hypothetical protein [Pseudoalteromonas agarivorans]ATC81484.1 hypothetical protein PAGA_a1005 [Pseudoalteromonas agarivorans DSM 14585]